MRYLWMVGLLEALMLAGCQEPLPPIEKLSGFAQGTTYNISYWSPEPVDAKQVEAAVNQTFADLDKVLSNYRPDSSIEQFNANPSTESQTVDPQIVSLLRTADRVSHLSHGCYDLTIKPLFDLWGFKDEKLAIPEDAAIQDAMVNVGMDKIAVVDDNHIRKHLAKVRIDLSSIAQGYSVGKISEVMEQLGVVDYLVEIGGELKTHGHKPDGKSWRIAVEKPLPGERELHKVVTLPKDEAMAVMTSGTYRHFFDVKGQRYSHILDARTGRPVNHDLVAVSVFHADPTIADAWSTALLCLGHEEGMKVADEEKLQALFVRQQGTEFTESKTRALTTSAQIAIN